MYWDERWGISLSYDDLGKNIIYQDKKPYSIDLLSSSDRYPKRGGNGVVFKLEDSDGNEYAIKICAYSQESAERYGGSTAVRVQRFQREIDALYRIGELEPDNVVKIFFHGSIEIDGLHHDYYVMEKCDCDLKTYFTRNKRLSTTHKIQIFSKIVDGFRVMHEVGVYHRDIKHTNILFMGNEPKVSDLGLVAYRQSDSIIDAKGEIIGPIGWLSPEAVNKFLVEKTPNRHNFNCIIGSESDVFQLAYLFWFMIQGNLPVGQIEREDFKSDIDDAFKLIQEAISHSHLKRPTIVQFKQRVDSLFRTSTH